MFRAPVRAQARLVLLALAALLLFVSIGVALHRAVAQYKLEAQSHRVSVWYSSQALVELHRLRSALLRLSEAGRSEGRDEMLERYEILLSRVALLSPENAEATEAVHRQLDTIYGMLEMLEATEPDLLAYRPSDDAVAARVHAVLDAAEDQLTRLNLELHQERSAVVAATRVSASQLTAVLFACLVGILLSAGVMIALLRRGMRRARETERTLRVLVDALPVAVTALDAGGRLVMANDAARRLYHLPAAEEALVGRPAVAAGAPRWLEEDAAAVLAERQPRSAEERVVALPDGGRRTLITSSAPVVAGREVVRVVSVGLDVSESRAADERIRFLAQHDPLTGLPNRLLFATQLREALRQARADRPAAVHCVDLDDFKGINDSLGHHVGDKLLVAAAARMAGALREGDTLARLGGDEFAVIQSSVASAEEATRTAARLVEVLAQPFRLEGYTLRSGGSVGTALAPVHGGTPEALLQRADIALYRAKALGRGRNVLFSADQEARLVERRRLEEDLHRALAEGQLSVVYQPKFSLADGRIAGAEALLRWHHPERGAIPPGIFVPVAEETGLIHRLTRFVLAEACRQTTVWSAAGLRVPVAVNLSGADFGAGHGLALVREALEATGADPRLLEVEVTEGVFLRQAERAAATVAELRRMGVHVALDDFGTGYSSLGYLQHLAFDVIKLDRQFVQPIEAAGPSRLIVDAVVRLAHGLGAAVVAEGVETEAQLHALHALGCDLAQGFLLGRPVKATEFAALASAPGLWTLRRAA